MMGNWFNMSIIQFDLFHTSLKNRLKHLIVLCKAFPSFAIKKHKGEKKMHIPKKIATATLIIFVLLMSLSILTNTPIPSTEAQLAAEQPVSGPIPAGKTLQDNLKPEHTLASDLGL